MTNVNYIEFKKRELHCHLCGALNLNPIKEICNKHGIEIPSGAELEKLLHIREPVGSMLEYFKPWAVLKQMPRNKNCIEMMISSVLKVRGWPFGESHVHKLFVSSIIVSDCIYTL